jgi:hypothetical protein
MKSVYDNKRNEKKILKQDDKQEVCIISSPISFLLLPSPFPLPSPSLSSSL